jgi:hypothetical protein
MDVRRPFVGPHSPKLMPGGDEPVGFGQAGLAVEAGESYVGRIALASDGDARVEVSLVWGPGAGNRQTVRIEPVSADYVTHPLTFTAEAASADARLEITATGGGAVHVGTVSLTIAGADLAGTGMRWRMAPESLDATVAVGSEPQVAVEEGILRAVPEEVDLPPFSVTIYRFDAR